MLVTPPAPETAPGHDAGDLPDDNFRPAPAIVNPGVALFDSAARRPPRPFALGLPGLYREKRSPFTAADRAWAAAELNVEADATAEQWADELERRTMSVAEYRAMLAETAEASFERYRRAEPQELAELGRVLTDAEIESEAEAARHLDAMTSGVMPW